MVVVDVVKFFILEFERFSISNKDTFKFDLFFLRLVIFIDWKYCDHWGPEIPRLPVRVCVCVSVCLSVCLCVCSRYNAETTGPISMKLSKKDP